MGRVAKKTPVAAVKEEEAQTVTEGRTRRTPKPNPKYQSDSVVVPKLESDDNSSDIEVLPAAKVVKSVKKPAETPASLKTKAPAAKPKGNAIKKQKLEYDEAELTDEADEKPEDEKPALRQTRTTRGGAEKESLNLGDDSVAIVDVSSIISKNPVKTETPKPAPVTKTPARKRGGPDESPVDDQPKKKKEEPVASMIKARKSYIKQESKEKPKEEVKPEEEPPVEVKKEAEKVPLIRARRNAVESPKAEASPPVAEKKPKIEVLKVEEVKKLPTLRKSEPLTKVSPMQGAVKTLQTLPNKLLNNNIRVVSAVNTPPKPVPRILNSMVTPKGKQSPNVKLAGDGSDKKVFSIDLTDDSVKERKIISSPIKTPIIRPSPVAVKENIANNKPQILLKSKLESELVRMKASANMAKRQSLMIPGGQSRLSQASAQSPMAARRITKFESWYVIDVKNQEQTPFRHTHTHSLMKLGNSIKEIQLPSSKWDYKVTLQRRQKRSENNNEDEEVYTGETQDKSIEADKANYEPSCILFKRSHREANKITIDRSLMLKLNAYTITMNGKQCKLIGAPDDIKSPEDLETLISIIDSCSLSHSCVELVTNQDVITIC